MNLVSCNRSTLRHHGRFVMRPVLSFFRNFLLIATAVLSCAVVGDSQQKPAPTKKMTPAGAEVKPKIRTITAFINLDPAQYQQQVAETLQMLRRAKTVFESRGYQVQTIRIATQPFPEYTKGMTTQQGIAFFTAYDALADREKFAAG